MNLPYITWILWGTTCLSWRSLKPLFFFKPCLYRSSKAIDGKLSEGAWPREFEMSFRQALGIRLRNRNRPNDERLWCILYNHLQTHDASMGLVLIYLHENHKLQPNVGKYYIPYMDLDPMGKRKVFTFHGLPFSVSVSQDPEGRTWWRSSTICFFYLICRSQNCCTGFSSNLSAKFMSNYRNLLISKHSAAPLRNAKPLWNHWIQCQLSNEKHSEVWSIYRQLYCPVMWGLY